MVAPKTLTTNQKLRDRLLDARNWSRLPKRYGYDEETIYRNRRNILFSQITLVGGVASIIHSAEGLSVGNYVLPFLDLMMTVFFFVAYQLNESGRHRTAKVLLLIFLNLFFFFYSLLTPRDLGIYVFYFPWVAIAALIFNRDEHFWRIFFVSLSICLLLGLFISDFSFLSKWQLDLPGWSRSFIFNIITSLVITAIFIYLMIRMNEVSEDRLRKLTSEMYQKNIELQKSNEQLDRFIYSASHDIKLPVLSIKGLSHLASIDCQDEKALSYVSKIESQADKLGQFLLEMVEYTRNNRTSIRKEQVNLSILVDEVIENLSTLENASRVEFRKFVRIDEDVIIDRVRFMVILNNLISNAIQFHNYDLPNPWVKVMISKVGDSIQVMVADNGIGINDEHKDKIFELFLRDSDSPFGSGLGLFIVKETVEKMNGKIQLSTSEGMGACFRIDLPLVA